MIASPVNPYGIGINGTDRIRLTDVPQDYCKKNVVARDVDAFSNQEFNARCPAKAGFGGKSIQSLAGEKH